VSDSAEGMARSPARRPLHGFLLLDKPRGMTSNRALQRVKALFRADKAGHTGSLDPIATGLLPVCFGAATRLAEYLLASRKTYRVECLLGTATDTGDADGRVVARAPVPDLPLSNVAAVLATFLGDSKQVPPMYSALKHGGRRLYALARSGATVARSPRPITVHMLSALNVNPPRIAFTVECSKGTYIRSLAEDVAAALGTVGHVEGLRRLAAGPFDASQAHGLPEIEAAAERGTASLDRLLLGLDDALPDWPAVDLDRLAARRLCQGQTLDGLAELPNGLVKLYEVVEAGRELIGIGETLADGRLRPHRIFAQAAMSASDPGRVEVEYSAGRDA
jgi:tRNA pseudouridine55 synthase